MHQPEGFPGQRLVILPPDIAAECSRKPVIRDLAITHIGAFSASPQHYVERPSGAAQHILIGCLSGKGHCGIGRQRWQVNASQLLFLPPRLAHRYFADPISPWTIFWIHFQGRRAGDYLESLGVSSQRPLLQVGDMKAIGEAFEDTYRHTHHGFGDAALLGMSTGLSRLLGLAKVHQRSAGNRGLQSEDRLTRLLSRIRSDPAHPWNLSEMAEAAGMSIPHFSELCRRQTGMPPTAYLIRLRLQRAMELLMREGCNVAETARAVGYEDPFYFSRLFRKHLGMPPSAIRQES